MHPEQRLIIVPGLNDDVKGISFATENWPILGIEPIIIPGGWSGSESLDDKCKRLSHLINQYSSQEAKVNLLGISAGGSLVINAFCQNPKNFDKVVCVYARMCLGDTLAAKDLQNPVYQQSVIRAQNNLKTLSADNTAKILTIRPLYDGFVPTCTMLIDGALNIRVPSFFGHTPGIYLALTLFRGPIINFLQQHP